jgi:hypothetical protein
MRGEVAENSSGLPERAISATKQVLSKGSVKMGGDVDIGM